MRIFISYASEDARDYARRLNDILKKGGHDSFLADHDLSAGENVWKEKYLFSSLHKHPENLEDRNRNTTWLFRFIVTEWRL